MGSSTDFVVFVFVFQFSSVTTKSVEIAESLAKKAREFYDKASIEQSAEFYELAVRELRAALESLSPSPSFLLFFSSQHLKLTHPLIKKKKKNLGPLCGRRGSGGGEKVAE